MPFADFLIGRLNESIFHDKVTFYHAEFLGGDFSRAEFLGISLFREDKFLEKIYFNGANFQKAVDFSNQNLKKHRFIELDFKKAANFTGAKFQEAATFTGAKFQEADFTDAEFNGDTKFEHVLFEGGEKIIFDVKKLSKVSFLNSDITRVWFGDRVLWGDYRNKKFTVVDEVTLENSLVYCESLRYLLSLRDIIKEDENRRIDLYDNKNLLHIKFYRQDDKAIVQSDNTNKEYEYSIKRDRNRLIIYPQPEFDLDSIKAIYRNLKRVL